MLNALTVDVEDYYQVSAFESTVRFENWPTYESRVERSKHRLLDLFDEHRVTATFFVLGWEAERRPRLVAEIVSRGREVASHGYRHHLVYTKTPAECRDDILRSKRGREDTAGSRCSGFERQAIPLWRNRCGASTF